MFHAGNVNMSASERTPFTNKPLYYSKEFVNENLEKGKATF